MKEQLSLRLVRPRTLGLVVAGGAGAILAGIAAGVAFTHLLEPPPATPRAVRSTPVSPIPVRLQISAIGLSADIESVGVTSSGTMAVPQNPADVGWYSAGVRPGQPGDAVIDGDAVWVSQPAAFARLGDLKAGDQVRLGLSDGSTLTFRVVSVTRYPFTLSQIPGLFGRTGSPRLSLVTSTAEWDGKGYQPRLVVNAVLERPARR
jgi:hypothetical protein